MPDLLGDEVGGTVGVEDAEAGGLLADQGVVGGAHSTVKLLAQSLEAVGAAVVAQRSATQSAGWVEVEQEGEVRAERPAGQAIGGLDGRRTGRRRWSR